jgi:hypothetical protein
MGSFFYNLFLEEYNLGHFFWYSSSGGYGESPGPWKMNREIREES